MISYKQQHSVKKYLKETENVPEMSYIVTRDFLEKVYNSYSYKCWELKKSCEAFKKAVIKELEPIYERFKQRIKRVINH